MGRTIFFLSAFLFLLSLCLSPWTVQSQSLPPARSSGFVYKNHRVNSNTIHLEAFYDPVCPYSRDSWPPLKQAVDHYESRVLLTVHLLPLPYHDNAFAASRALFTVNNLSNNTNATFRLLEQFFRYQEEKFYNARTRDITKADVTKKIVKFAAEAIGDSYFSAIESGFNDTKTDIQTRISFKLSTSRGVYGTPTFYLNGFAIPDAETPGNYSGWRSLIDPLISGDL